MKSTTLKIREKELWVPRKCCYMKQRLDGSADIQISFCSLASVNTYITRQLSNLLLLITKEPELNKMIMRFFS